jgi:hypothetical protein
VPRGRPETPTALQAVIPPAPPPAAPPAISSDATQGALSDAGNPAAPLAVAAGLGVDIGGATNYEGLRTLWHSTRNSDPELMEEVFPVVTVRENGKTHGPELRLVVGPMADAEAAGRLCSALAAAHHYCQPVAFQGQRLSKVDTAKAPPHPGAGPSPLPKSAPGSAWHLTK